MSPKRVRERCHFVSGSLCMWRHDQGRDVRQKCLLRHEPTFSCSLLVKSEPAWLRPGKLDFHFEAKTVLLRCVPQGVSKTKMLKLYPGGISTYSESSWFFVCCFFETKSREPIEGVPPHIPRDLLRARAQTCLDLERGGGEGHDFYRVDWGTYVERKTFRRHVMWRNTVNDNALSSQHPRFKPWNGHTWWLLIQASLHPPPPSTVSLQAYLYRTATQGVTISDQQTCERRVQLACPTRQFLKDIGKET